MAGSSFRFLVPITDMPSIDSPMIPRQLFGVIIVTAKKKLVIIFYTIILIGVCRGLALKQLCKHIYIYIMHVYTYIKHIL